MKTSKFFSRLKQRWASSHRHSTKGFTLLELLVVTAIAGGIVAGLMFIVVQLLNTDQREASRSETQREMQLALDYISTDLREAVYVYTGSQMACVQANGSCQGALSNYLPPSLSQNSVPVLAFWKHERFPAPVQARCSTTNARTFPGVNCEVGSSYALVVYSVSTANTGTWQGRSRLTRYVLSEFNRSSPTVSFNQGYVNPGSFSNFGTWPWGRTTGSSAIDNLQGATVSSGRPAGRPSNTDARIDVLVDFVDNAAAPATTCRTEPGLRYNFSPASAATGFYACVGVQNDGVTPLTGNHDVILYLRGNVAGRAGYLDGFRTTADTLPTLETRVLARGALGRNPGQ